MADSTSPPGVTRRTVARGAAWAVPAVAVAVPASAMAVSGYVPPPPVITFGNACGNVGAKFKGCGGDKTIQVPLTLTNLGPTDIVFQITSMYTCNNCALAPTGPGAGVYSGVRGIWRTPAHTPVTNHNDCTAVTASNCAGGVTSGSIVVPSGSNALNYWIESVSLGSASNFQTTINWRLLNASDCTVISTGQAQTAGAISPNNCDGGND